MAALGQPLVSIVVPTLNAGDGFKDLLGRLKTQQVEGGVEVLVIDSGSTDGTVGLAREAGAKIVSISRRQFNHGRTRNRAIGKARGKHVALTVQDALPTDDFWLARLLAPLITSPEVAGSYGLQVAPTDLGLLAITRSWSWYEANREPQIKAVDGLEAFEEQTAEDRLALIAFDNVTSCIRRVAWERTPFPERCFAEDMAWAKEILLAGGAIAYVPTAQVWHGHERDWRYEFRRAYVAGDAQRNLVDWPASEWRTGDVLAALRRMAFFLRTHRYDGLETWDEIERFLLAEMYHYEPMRKTLPGKIYLKVLDYALGLTRMALRLCPEGTFPDSGWIELFRFANVAVLGEELGTASCTGRTILPVGERMAWTLLDTCLNRGV
jgi:rhamnosyltransferase